MDWIDWMEDKKRTFGGWSGWIARGGSGMTCETQCLVSEEVVIIGDCRFS